MDDLIPAVEQEKSFDWGAKLYAWYFLAKTLLRRYWWILFLTVSLGIAWQTYKELQRDPVYATGAKMHVADRMAVPGSEAYQEMLTNFYGTQVEFMTSQRVRQRAQERVRALHPDLQPIGVSVSASVKPETSIFLLRAFGGEPEYTREFLNAVMEEYINFRKEMRAQTSESTLLAIKDELLRLEEKISQEEAAIVDFQRENNLVFIKEQGNTAGAYLSQLEKQLADLKTQLRLLDSLGLRSQLADGSSWNETGAEVLQLSESQLSATFRDTQQLLSQYRAQRDEFAIYLKPRHPKIIQLNEEIERTENLLSILREQALAQVKEQRLVLQSRIANLQEVIKEWELTALENSRLAAEFDQLNAQLNRSRDTYQRLLESTQDINMSQQLVGETVSIFEYAGQAYQQRSSMPFKVAQGGIVGFIMGAGLLFFLGAIDSRILSADDLRKRFNIPVLGMIPRELPNDEGHIELLQPRDQRHLFAESCRTLRSSLLFLQGEDSNLKVFAITSSIPEEGKSTISSNIATAIAFTASRTLLIDSDLRRGALAKLFGLPSFPGLSEYLQRGRSIDSIIHSTPVENLDFIPTGKLPDRPSELLMSDRMDKLLDTLRDRYDYIIIDTAPILAADDTSGFAAKTDAVIFVVRSGHTQIRQAATSVDRLTMRSAQVSGFVLNEVDVQGTDYYYYRKYNQYYVQYTSSY